jgi:hypothetical protein
MLHRLCGLQRTNDCFHGRRGRNYRVDLDAELGDMLVAEAAEAFFSWPSMARVEEMFR